MQSIDQSGPDQNQRISLEAQAFVQQFLPAGFRDSQAFLFDWEATQTFTPTSEQLSACLVGYITLLRLIDATDAIWIINAFVMSASELTLTYLGRGQEAGHKIPPEIVQALRTISARLIVRMDELMGSYFRDFDGLRRLKAIAEQLETFANE